MPRQPTPITKEFPFHITSRSNNQEWFYIPMEDCWEIFVEQLNKVHKNFSFQTYAFILMSNHYHWLLSTPLENLGEGMDVFQTQVSKNIGKQAGRINRIFGARYKPTVITTESHYANVYRYIFQNPLRAGICEKVEQWQWNSINDKRVIISSWEAFETEIPKTGTAKWLNTVPAGKGNQFIRKGLRRYEFSFPRDPKSKKMISGKEFL